MRIAVVGKGGAGKSVISGTMARQLARRGHRVLALDSDTVPGLAFSIGAEPPAEPPLRSAAEQDERGRWRLRKGIGPVRAVQRYSTEAPDGVRLLQCGKLTGEGVRALQPSVAAFYGVVHRLARARSFSDWTVVGDLPAGPRQPAFNWAPYAEAYLLVVEPTWQSALTARRIARIIRSRRGKTVLPVANKVSGRRDVDLIEERLGEPVIAAIPADEAVRTAERMGVPLIDHAPSSRVVSEIEGLVDALEQARLPEVVGV